MAKRDPSFQTVTVSGAMLPVDILRKIIARDKTIDGLSPDSFHLPEGTKVSEAISQSWSVVRAHWDSFSDARDTLDDDDAGTTITNDRWLLPLFKELDYGRLATTTPPEIEEKTYSIRRFYNNSPIHLIGCNLPLDSRTKGAVGAATASPHAMMQEFLNRSDDHLWAFLSNGLQLRILRDNVSLSRQAYVEFDLEAMMEGEVYADFALLWMLCHQSRVEAEKQEDCWLEQWSKVARDAGTRVLNDLRNGVADAIEALGRGFIGHPRNDKLREKLQESGELSKDDFYRQLLRTVYRLLFLFVAEDRGLLHPEDADSSSCELYDQHYSTRRLREMSEKLRGSKHSDLWHSLSLVFDRLGQSEGCSELGLIGLGSFLWNDNSTPDLQGPTQTCGDTEPVLITNDDLLTAVRALAFVEQNRILRPVDYRNLGSEELGSVYESLLELHPDMHVEARQFDLRTAAGNERKTSGSYYTPDSLVQCLLDSALDPVVEDHLKGKKGEAAENAILEMKVCDPACGSGHFLIAASHRMARHLARVRTGESEPSPGDYQHALRDVIGRCIYGVDINPMAVELCKVSLWIEAIEPGKPLSFLDSHIQCGNSLLGTTPKLLADGIPDDAFKPIEGDGKKAAAALKKRNKAERKDRIKGQGKLFSTQDGGASLTSHFSKLTDLDDSTVDAVVEKEQMHADLVASSDYQDSLLIADTWCSTFVWKKDESEEGKLCPTDQDFAELKENPAGASEDLKLGVRSLSQQYQFFHWHLAFPDVFVLPDEAEKAENEQTGWSRGFDVVLGNPPWELVAADQGQEASRKHAGEQHLFKSNDYSILNGRRDLYKLFFVRGPQITRRAGRMAFFMPFGIFVEDDSAAVRRSLFDEGSVLKLRHFQNHQKRFFQHVHASYRFCQFTYTPEVALLHEFSSVARLPEEIPHQAFFRIERSQFDAELSKARSAVLYPNKEYGIVHQFVSRELQPRNLGDFRVVAEFHSSTDKAWVKNQQEDDSDWVLLKNRNIHQFNAGFAPPEAFVSRPDVIARLERKGLPEDRWLDRNARLLFRDIARNDDEHTLIATLAPPGYLSTYDTPMAVPQTDHIATQVSELLFFGGAFNAYLFDFLIRPYVDKHIKGYTLNRVPWPNADVHEENTLVTLVKSIVLELTYTSWKLDGFARDYGYEGPPFRKGEERLFLLRCELDAAYFSLYLSSSGESRAAAQSLQEIFPTPRDAVEYIMETFPIVKRKDIARTEIKDDKGEVTTEGTYITKDKILAIYDEMQQAIDSGQPYQTRLDPPPGPPTDPDGNFIPMAQWDETNWPSHIHPPREAESTTTGRNE